MLYVQQSASIPWRIFPDLRFSTLTVIAAGVSWIDRYSVLLIEMKSNKEKLSLRGIQISLWWECAPRNSSKRIRFCITGKKVVFSFFTFCLALRATQASGFGFEIAVVEVFFFFFIFAFCWPASCCAIE